MIVIIIILILSLSGCLDDSSNITSDNKQNVLTEKEKFLGLWETEESINNPNILNKYEFYDDDTMLSTYIIYEPSETHEGLANFQINNGEICMQAQPHGAITDGDSYCYTYKFYDGETRVVLESEELPSVTLIKIE